MANSHAVYLKPVQWDWRPILQLILAIIGIIGNSIVIHVYRRSRKLIRSTTNTMVAALATADLITSICIIPIPELVPVPDNGAGHFYCKLVHSSNIMWISIVASIFTLTILSVDRYFSVAHSVSYKKTATITFVRITIVVIWLASFVINTFSYYVTHLRNGICTIEFPSVGFQKFLGVGLFIIEYLVPMIIMLFANIRTIQVLHKQVSSFSAAAGGGNEKTNHQLSLLRARRRVIIMLLIVIISFIVCWSPDQFAFLVFNLGYVPSEYLYGNLYRFFVVLAFANSCVNPIIYTIVNKNFREAIKQQLPASMRSTKYKENTLFEVPFADSAAETKVSQDGTTENDVDAKADNTKCDLV